MPPAGSPETKQAVDAFIKENNVMIFSKSYCPFCKKVKEALQAKGIAYKAHEVDIEANGADLHQEVIQRTAHKTVPAVFVNGAFVGGADDTLKALSSGRFQDLLRGDSATYDYDLVVIGGGSGGLASSKQAAELGMKVAVCDFVVPSPQGSTWGLGGTCVNVGCIPKKLFHQAALLGEAMEDAKKYGWELPEKVNHNWETMREAVQNHIGSLNWGYRVQLREKSVTYINALASFVDAHTIKTVDRRKQEKTITSRYFVLAMGGRPRYPDVPGAQDLCITSDDLFSLGHAPGKTLVIGASYVSLECAGFLKGLGFDVTVMVRSILLRGFDQEMAERAGQYMQDHGVNFLRGFVPTKIEKVEEGTPGQVRVHYKSTNGAEEKSDVFNTVMFAVGRDPCTSGIGLENIGVKLNPKNGKVLADAYEQTNLHNIYAIGDILDGKLELTPVAIQAGRLLAKRLFAGATEKMDYVNVPTTVFTPLEYGSCGLSEEDAISQYGEANIEVYRTNFQPLEYTVSERETNACYTKVICSSADQERVVGFHILSPNAGEVTQGFGIGLRLGATKEDFDRLVGIHPTVAEEVTTLNITKRSGLSIEKSGC